MATTPTPAIQSLADIDTVVDTDVHTNASVADDLEPYLPDPFDDLLTIDSTTRLFPEPGYVQSGDYGTTSPRKVRTADDLREARRLLSTDEMIITGGPLSPFGMGHHEEVIAALATAYNDWMLDRLVDEVADCYGTILVAPQTPELAAEEIDRLADEKELVGVFIPSGAVNPPLGRERYFPIYEAAEDAGLPVLFHGGNAGVMATLPTHWHNTKRQIDVHVSCHPVMHMFHLSTLLTNGVPVRFPDLKFVFQESGIGWIPFFMHRYDNEYSEKRQDAPLLEKAPSEYIRDQFYFSSQPVEGVESADYASRMIRLFGGEDSLMFSSDYPHPDFDNSDYLLDCLTPEFTDDEIERIYGGTAIEVFDL